MTRDLARVLTLKDATMLVVSSILGVGIFFTPSSVAKLLPHPSVFLLAWLVGGALAFFGALANAELGAMFPRAGGNYVYLREAVHPMAGFLVAWQSFFAIFTGTIATLAVGFASSFTGLFALPESSRKLVAVLVIVLVSLANARATRLGAVLNTLTAYLKVFVFLGLVVFGLFAPAHSEVSVPMQLSGGSFVMALSPILFSYSGWNASVFVGGEIRDAERNIPRSLFFGLLISTLIYLTIAWVYVRVLGMSGIAASENVGLAAAKGIFGAQGTLIAELLLMLSVLGCLDANILTGPRVAYALSRDQLFLASAKRVSKSGSSPVIAILVQAVAATLAVLFFDNLESVLDYTTFAVVLATIADTSALYVLRVRQKDRPRPYRAHGYPIIPGIYLLANAVIAALLLAAKPKECLLGLLVIAVGLPFYFVFKSSASAPAT